MASDSSPTEPVASGRVNSADGTSVGYRFLGHGPAIVLLHGAGQSATNLTALANGLADRFTVYIPDRRGRGMSPSYGTFEGLRTEVDDLCALLDATGAHFVFGLSAGAVIALETALVRPDITKLALYEPPLSFDGVVHGAWVPRYEKMLASGKQGSALVAVLKDTADRNSITRYLPQILIAAPLDFIIKKTENRPAPPGAMSLRELIPTLHCDAQTVLQAAGPLDRFAELRSRVLLLGGSKSARNLTASVDGLSKVLPNASRVTLGGAGHTAADNSRTPDRVAAELRTFFVEA